MSLTLKHNVGVAGINKTWFYFQELDRMLSRNTRNVSHITCAGVTGTNKAWFYFQDLDRTLSRNTRNVSYITY